MNDDNIHSMMDRAHYAEIREARLRIAYADMGLELAAAHQRIAALTQDCNIMCNALQRIEAGEKEPRMIARRTLEHWSEKAALSQPDADKDYP
jgi:hypothetical protein